MPQNDVEVVIIGGGLAGMVAGARLSQLDRKCLIIDSSLAQAKGQLGGFAKFSGAKFSLPPAGLGLVNVVGSEARLWEHINAVSALLKLDFSAARSSVDQTGDKYLRSYSSLVLQPMEIDDLLERLTRHLEKGSVPIVKGDCSAINISEQKVAVEVRISNDEFKEFTSNAIFYAAGRLGEKILENAGIAPTNQKGLDVGARIEFNNTQSLQGLIAQGPDAKYILKRCRTFCLNAPGIIYRYPFSQVSIPGGIIGPPSTQTANFGILYRSRDKTKLLKRINSASKKIGNLETPTAVRKSVFGESEETMKALYGRNIVKRLNEFCNFLSEKHLVDWNDEHYIHLPLLDWHWNTYSLPNTFQTSNNRIYCIGDSSGHARGLLQAALTGWITAEEFSNES